MPDRVIMKLKWRIIGLFRGRYKKQVHFWIFIGLMTLLTILYSHITQVNEARLHLDLYDNFATNRVKGQDKTTKEKPKDSILQELDDELLDKRIDGFPNNWKNSEEYHSSEEINLNNYINKIENEVRHMGIYRKTLSKALKKSKKTGTEKNSSTSQTREMIGGYSHMMEVTNLKDEQSEDDSLEANGYISVVGTRLQEGVIAQKHIQSMKSHKNDSQIIGNPGKDIQGPRNRGNDIHGMSNQDIHVMANQEKDIQVLGNQGGRVQSTMNKPAVGMQGVDHQGVKDQGLEYQGMVNQGRDSNNRKMQGWNVNGLQYGDKALPNENEKMDLTVTNHSGGDGESSRSDQQNTMIAHIGDNAINQRRNGMANNMITDNDNSVDTAPMGRLRNQPVKEEIKETQLNAKPEDEFNGKY